MKKWHVFVMAVAALVSFIALNETVGTMMSLIVVGSVSVIGTCLVIIYRFGPWKKKESTYFRGGLSPEQAKYIAAKHLEDHHSCSLFIMDGGSPDLQTTRYLVPMNAMRCYPSAGEEAWIVRARIYDKRFFGGLPTKVILYIDGAGMVMSDMVMNDSTFLDERRWVNPELYFREMTSKTPRPRSIKEIIAQDIEEKGEIPGEVSAEILKEETSGMPKKVD